MNKTIKICLSDINANKGNWEVIFFLIVFRFSTYLKDIVRNYKFGLLFFPVYLLVRIIYKILSIVYVMEIPVGTKIGDGLIIYHLKGIVINGEAKIGTDVTINHFVTISDQVAIADGVTINPLSVIIKGNIGKNSVVGAGSVVTKDVEENTIVVGSPAKSIGTVK